MQRVLIFWFRFFAIREYRATHVTLACHDSHLIDGKHFVCTTSLTSMLQQKQLWKLCISLFTTPLQIGSIHVNNQINKHVLDECMTRSFCNTLKIGFITL